MMVYRMRATERSRPMSYDERELIDQREAEEDELFSLFYGYGDLKPMVKKICDHLLTLDLNSRYKNVIRQVMQKHDRVPKLAIIVFAIWLCPDLQLGKNAQPRRFEPFERNAQKICMDILEGRFLSVQEFVGSALTDYLVGPKES